MGKRKRIQMLLKRENLSQRMHCFGMMLPGVNKEYDQHNGTQMFRFIKCIWIKFYILTLA